MSIPLDRLYHYIESIAQDIRKDNVVIYRFWPHGSKKQEDLRPSRQLIENNGTSLPHVICYDQEPLNYNLYDSPTDFPESKMHRMTPECKKIHRQIKFDRLNLRNYPLNIYDHAIIVHSELRSSEVEQYKNNNFIPVYYWFHGLISIDWYRYARYVQQNKKIKQTFLIYNRAWSGTREYRLKFSELLIRTGLEKHSKTFCNPVDVSVGQHYKAYDFNNPKWKPLINIEDYLPNTDVPPDVSGDFDLEDYESTDIEVVLETLFDDDRLHLTEKSLRPMALGQPFISVATHGTLEYLRSYGFKTFDSIWNEDYDLDTDPASRLVKIVNLMKTITNWSSSERLEKMSLAKQIAEYNKKHFFSPQFQTQLINELRLNLTQALSDIEAKNTGLQFINRRKKVLKNVEYKNYILKTKLTDTSRTHLAHNLKLARKYKLRTLPST